MYSPHVDENLKVNYLYRYRCAPDETQGGEWCSGQGVFGAFLRLATLLLELGKNLVLLFHCTPQIYRRTNGHYIHIWLERVEQSKGGYCGLLSCCSAATFHLVSLSLSLNNVSLSRSFLFLNHVLVLYSQLTRLV
jgi:hypothetical protein